MSFLYPFFLILLPLSAIPLILFLGTKGKKREILFSTLFLLRSREFKEERIKQKFRLWLLIIIRILMLITIILLLSRPRYFGYKWGTVYFDASFSMREGKEDHLNSLKKLFSLFGESRVIVLNTFENSLFVLDTTIVPSVKGNDVFYTDGRVPYLPACKIICSNKYKQDSWVYVQPSGEKMLIHVKVWKPSWIYVYDSIKIIDSLYVSPSTNKILYDEMKDKSWYVFKLNENDAFPYNNVFYYIPSVSRTPVRLLVNSIPLTAFFSTSPFMVSDTGSYCVSQDRLPANCNKSVVFLSKKSNLWEKYVKEKDSILLFGNIQAVLLTSGIKQYLIVKTDAKDTSFAFFDPYFVKSFSDYLRVFFKENSVKYNLKIRDLRKYNCRKVTGMYEYQGIFICNGKKVAVNPDPVEYTVNSVCGNRSLTLEQIANSILLPEKILTYFLVLLFVLETLLVYVV